MKLFIIIIRILLAIGIIVAMIIAIKKEDKNKIYFRNAPPVQRTVLPYGD
jgi:hypothetical protein